MAYADTVIPRLRAAGIRVHDIRGALPQNFNNYNGKRPINAITRIGVHHDAEFRSTYYDSVARYRNQANYHINKDWGGGWRGNGLQYPIKVDNVGDWFICRDFELILWNVSDANYNTLSICLDGLRQPLTREMSVTLKKGLDVLTTQCPEFPAARANVAGHREIPSNSTECPGNPMMASPVTEYRNTGNINAAAFAWNDPPAAPAPAPAPKPTPVEPEWKRNQVDIPDAILYASRDGVALINMETGATVRTYTKGQSFEIVYGTSVGGTNYVITKYSKSSGTPNGLRSVDLVPNDPNKIPDTPPVVEPPKEEPETPTTPPPPNRDDQQDKEISDIKALLNKIVEFLSGIFTGFKR